MEWIRVFASGADARARLTENKPQLILIRGLRICVVLRAGKFFAFQDACTHSFESLSKGTVNYLGEIICPGHGYGFSILTGRESSERCRDLITYLTKEDDTGFFIGI